MRLVLWDIDHTLIETGHVGEQVFRSAFVAITGKDLVDMPDPTGLTEQVIFEKACQSVGVDKPGDLFGEFAAAQAAQYRAHAEEMRARGRVLPGVQEVLTRLARRDDVLQSVLSGNPRPSARVKLETFGLDHYLDLDVSAGGDDAAHRPDLVPLVWERVHAKHGVRPGPGETVVVGDSPADVTTGRENRCRVVAVATGKTAARELAAEYPSVLLADLTDTEAALDALLS